MDQYSQFIVVENSTRQKLSKILFCVYLTPTDLVRKCIPELSLKSRCAKFCTALA